ncbi:MAG: 2-C-methyl-D-erythritol 4-phosphate cytidylyltransferase [Verrucomicrobiae bacterium]|nr:2-C-methyl-D-erythritol 4-phosphate cytidylyltransferase [Verrucomicrobiae bacterium]
MTSAILVAAGRGTRMGPDVDKLFLEVGGRPVVAHTWGRLEACPAVDALVLVVRAGLEESFAGLARDHGFRKPFRVVPGGAERQDSVAHGLAALSRETALVAIQDGARPCTSPEVIARCLAAAARTGAAVAAQRVTDTVKASDGDRTIASHLDRSRLWTVQTPQCFRRQVIERALEATRTAGRRITDDTAACELTGQSVELVECPEPNPKVTTPADLPWIEWLLRRDP